jgi:hypothetical protein
VVRSDHAQRRAVRGADRPAERADPNIFAVRQAVAVFHVMVGVVFQVIADALNDPFAILRVQVRRPRIVGVLDIELFRYFILAAAEKSLVPRRTPELTGLQIPIPYGGIRRP